MANGIYLVKNPAVENNDWGAFRAMVVSAASEEAARLIRPFHPEYPEDPASDAEWPGTPESLIVTYLGESVVPVGLILCYNVGS